MKTNLIFTLQIEGWHRWPDAPNEYAYLANRHRHIFHIKCALGVDDQDREIEIVDAKAKLNQFLLTVNKNPIEGHGCDFGPMSCEHIASVICSYLRANYGKRFIKVNVLEDGENGATVML